jgi:two-component system chemotaxis response regulator CheB
MKTRPRQNEADATIARAEDKMIRSGQIARSELDAIGKRSALTCPDCGGAIWRIGEGLPLRYRCHTGHAFSAASLENEQREHSENAIWKVIRGIEERIYLAREQLEQERSVGSPISDLLERIARLEEARVMALSIVRSPALG